jgi:hypothetical protein
MTQAQSRRLRMRYLLLLAPLLVAGTPSPRPLATSLLAGQLVFENPPLEATPGSCIPLTVKAENPSGAPLNAGVGILVTLGQQTQSPGTFHRLSGCQSLTDEMLIPAGSNSARVWFRPMNLGRVVLVASDGVLGLTQGTSRPINVLPGLTTRLIFTAVPAKARSRTTVLVTVTAYEDYPNTVARGYTGQVSLSASPPFPGSQKTETFVASDNGQKTFEITFPEPGTYELTVRDTESTTIQPDSTRIPVVRPRVSVSPRTTQQAACLPVRFTLSVLNDDPSLPPPGPVLVSFCRPEGNTRVKLGYHEFGINVENECVSGLLDGSRIVDWSSNDPMNGVTFLLKGAEVVGDLTVSWTDPVLSFDYSRLSFPGSGTSETTLASYTSVPVQLELKNTCNRPMEFPEKSVGFNATSPLTVTSLAHPAVGVWTANVGLACSEPPSVPLFLQPTLEGAVLYRGPNEPVRERILPVCGPSLIHLSLRTKEESTLTMVGSTVQFEAKLENKGTEAIRDGVLKLSAQGLTLVEAEVDGEALPLQDNAGVLPTLEPTKTLTVKLTAKAPAEPDPQVSLRAAYMTQAGAPLTPEQSVTLSVVSADELGVNVGCGSQAASLPGHLVSWMVLLLAASRPWERSRRLPRRERTDR